MQEKASRHKFKPDINPVSKLIAERDKKEATLLRSESSDKSTAQKLSISVHEKLYLSRNNSQSLLNPINRS
jgi:hypothetical protein